MLHTYSPKDLSTCLASRRAVFIGDSATRQLFFAFAHTIDSSLPGQPENNEQKHIDYTLTSIDQTELLFIWDPFLNTTKTQELLQLMDTTRVVSTPPSIHTPALLVIGSGLWFLRYGGSNGLSQWEASIEEILRSIHNHDEPIADVIAFLPVEHMVPSKLSQERAMTMHNTDIDAMNSDLRHRIHPPLGYIPPASKVLRSSMEVPRLVFPEAFLDMLDPSQTDDGLHYSEKIMKAQTSVLLNLRCNDILPKKFPFDKTCCRSYPSPSYYQLLFLFLLISWGFLARVTYSRLCTWFPLIQRMAVIVTFPSQLSSQDFMPFFHLKRL